MFNLNAFLELDIDYKIVWAIESLTKESAYVEFDCIGSWSLHV